MTYSWRIFDIVLHFEGDSTITNLNGLSPLLGGYEKPGGPCITREYCPFVEELFDRRPRLLALVAASNAVTCIGVGMTCELPYFEILLGAMNAEGLRERSPSEK